MLILLQPHDTGKRLFECYDIKLSLVVEMEHVHEHPYILSIVHSTY